MPSNKEQDHGLFGGSIRRKISRPEENVRKLSVRDGKIFLSVVTNPPEPNEVLLKAADRYHSRLKRR